MASFWVAHDGKHVQRIRLIKHALHFTVRKISHVLLEVTSFHTDAIGLTKALHQIVNLPKSGINEYMTGQINTRIESIEKIIIARCGNVNAHLDEIYNKGLKHIIVGLDEETVKDKHVKAQIERVEELLVSTKGLLGDPSETNIKRLAQLSATMASLAHEIEQEES